MKDIELLKGKIKVNRTSYWYSLTLIKRYDFSGVKKYTIEDSVSTTKSYWINNLVLYVTKFSY